MGIGIFVKKQLELAACNLENEGTKHWINGTRLPAGHYIGLEQGQGTSLGDDQGPYILYLSSKPDTETILK